MTNGLGAGILNCPDGKPASAYAYQPGAVTATNTGNLDIICEADLGVPPCNTMPGFNSAGDNVVAISTDWSIPGINGCPNGRVIVVLQCNDGSGALLSLNGGCALLGYDVEAAYNWDGASLSLDVGTLTTTQKNGRPRILNFTRSGGMDVFDVQVDPPSIQSDCTPGTYGAFFLAQGYCADTELNCAGIVAPSRGKLYSSTQPCSANDSRPGTTARASWTLQTLDAAGHAMVSLPTPATGMCNFLGSSTLIGTAESDVITGFVAAQNDPTAASPVAEAVRATKKGNSVEVTFNTSSELGLAGFNVYAAGKAKGEIKLNSGLIASQGVGGAGSSYAVSFAVADFKGNRGVIVESVLTDGTTLRAPKVDF